MDNASSILEIVYKVKDEATSKIKEIGDQVDKNAKSAVNMSQAFQVAGGVFLGVGAAGVGALKLLSDAATSHQVAMANVDTTLKLVSQTMSTHSVMVGGNSEAVKANKKAIDDHIRTLKEQKLEYETMGGKHKEEIAQIDNEIKAQQLLKLRADDVVTSKAHLVSITDGAIGSFKTLKDTADTLAQSYLQLGFADHDTELAFAQDLRVTKNLSDAKIMLSVSADLARAKHISLTDATMGLTKAYEGSTKILKTMGLEVEKGAKGMEVLTAVQKATAGQADAYSHTYAGAMEILNVNFEKLKATLGERLLPMMTGFVSSLAQMIGGLNSLDPKVYDTTMSIIKFVTVFSISAGTILTAASSITSFADTLASVNPQFRAVILIVTAVATIGYLLYTNWSKIGPIFNAINAPLSGLNKAFGAMIPVLQQFYSEFMMPLINAFVAELQPILKDIAIQFNTLFIPAWKRFMEQLVPLRPLLVLIGGALGALILGALILVTGAILALMKVLDLLMPIFVKVFSSMTSLITTFLKAIVDMGSVVGGVFSAIAGFHLVNLRNAFQQILYDIYSLTNNKVLQMVDPWVSMAHSVLNIVQNMVGGITSALHAITFPHISIGTGDVKVAGHDIKYPSIDVKWYENGGFVPGTGLAMLHQGEFVLSRAMLAGKQASPISNNYSNNSKLTIENVYIRNEADMDTLVSKFTRAMKYDSSS